MVSIPERRAGQLKLLPMRSGHRLVSRVVEAPPRLCRDQVWALVATYCEGSDSCTVLQAKDGKVVCRVTLYDGRTVVLKLWARHGLRAWLRRVTRTGPPEREVEAIAHLRGCGVNVPGVLGRSPLKLRGVPFTDAVVFQDIGFAGNAMNHLKRLLKEKRGREALDFEDAIIELTQMLLAARVIDEDHSMINVVVTATGEPTRVDFETARRVISTRLAPRLWATMLGRLVATFAFTVQPDVYRARAFALRLADRIGPPRCVLRRAGRLVQQMMETQHRELGIDTQLDLKW